MPVIIKSFCLRFHGLWFCHPVTDYTDLVERYKVAVSDISGGCADPNSTPANGLPLLPRCSLFADIPDAGYLPLSSLQYCECNQGYEKTLSGAIGPQCVSSGTGKTRPHSVIVTRDDTTPCLRLFTMLQFNLAGCRFYQLNCSTDVVQI